MSNGQKLYNQKLSFRIAEESQLLAEEKWLIEALAKLKKQRNCLQIERLHLESLKVKLKYGDKPPTTTAPSHRNQALATAFGNPFSSRNSIEFEVPVVSADTACNHEELNLAVSKSVFGQVRDLDYNVEEYEEEEDDCENILIDMNMLMNGKMD